MRRMQATLGIVEAPDEKSAIAKAVEHFSIPRARQNRVIQTAAHPLTILDDQNFEMLALGALERALIMIRSIVWLDANNPHRPVAPRAGWSVDRGW